MTKFEKKLAAAGIAPVRVSNLDPSFELYRAAGRKAGGEPVNYSAFKRGER